MKLLVVCIGVLLVTNLFGFSDRADAEGEMKAKIINLPKPVLDGKVSLEKAIASRRSVRSYSDKELSLDELSQLLWAAQGITDTRGLRAAPSAGALYPLEIYAVRKNGTFRYIPQGHKLEVVSSRDLRDELAAAAWGQGPITQAPLDIVICAVYERVTRKYAERGVRYTDIEVGHAAENLHLQAAALGLASVPIGAFTDAKVASVLGLSKKETPIYIIPVGYRK